MNILFCGDCNVAGNKNLAFNTIVRAIFIHYKVIDEVSVNGFINNKQKMVLWNHVIHTEHLNLFSFLVRILSHHRSIPPFFDTSIIPEKSPKVLKTRGFLAFLAEKSEACDMIPLK